MGARIIDFAKAKASRAQTLAAPLLTLEGNKAPAWTGERFHFWTGQSGKRYVHTIYSLIECPTVPASNYVLVHRDQDGHRTPLSFGRVAHQADSLNLAEIRHLGASLGANEVHIHLLAETAAEGIFIEADLRSTADIVPLVANFDRAVGQTHH